MLLTSSNVYFLFVFIVENTEFLQQAALEEYGPELHVALRSRRDELHYLRKLTELLFPYIFPLLLITRIQDLFGYMAI